MNNAIVKVLNSVAIDQTARRVAAQRGCEMQFADLDREELCRLLDRLKRKQRLIYAALGFKTKTQSKNLKTRLKTGGRTRKFDGRLAAELIRVGENIDVFSRRLAEMPDHTGFTKAVRKQIGALENEWREQHPGAIWDGRQLVAPNGAVFSQWIAAQSIGATA